MIAPIAVDTSALMAIVLEERKGPHCLSVLQRVGDLIMSAGTLTEALIVSTGKNQAAVMMSLIADFGIEIMPVTQTSARQAATAYRQWGKGFHPAALNFGDCFAYSLAKAQDCPLLYVGDDFARTDIRSALLTPPE